MAWIETDYVFRCKDALLVATREGGVDRNPCVVSVSAFGRPVATREGGVDRNMTSDADEDKGTVVATREGGVDRNNAYPFTHLCSPVATREGGVDRNINQTEKDIDELGRHPRGWRG